MPQNLLCYGDQHFLDGTQNIEVLGIFKLHDGDAFRAGDDSGAQTSHAERHTTLSDDGQRTTTQGLAPTRRG